ncbi:MAG: amidohydrolase family protein, partial [Micrococcales bacterium]|nr:amidohydrolase family protein [Micrococcales bacterium]
MILTSQRVLTPAGELRPGWVYIEGDRVAATGLGTDPGNEAGLGSGIESPAAGEEDVLYLGNDVISPGFVDMHCHGGGGASFTTGSVEDARQVLATHWHEGSTSVMASLVTDTPEVLGEHVQSLAPLVRADDLLGVHLEGPCLSRVHQGAHAPELLVAPAAIDLLGILDAAPGTVQMITIATELEGGLDAVAQLRERGAKVALGHSDATYLQTRAAIAAGVTVATHLCNAMRPLHHREPGPILAFLQDDAAWVELIADGVHLAAEVVNGLFAVAARRIVLVTDAMSAAGMGDGTALLGPLEVSVRDGVARLTSTGAIAGSTLTLSRAVRFSV